MLQDVSSHFHLNLTVFGGSGTVSGLLTDSQGATQSVELVLGARPANSSHTISLTPHIQCGQHLVTTTYTKTLNHVTVTGQLNPEVCVWWRGKHHQDDTLHLVQHEGGHHQQVQQQQLRGD